MTIRKKFQLKTTTIEVIIEKKDGMLWGIVENKGNFVATPYGKTKDEVLTNLKELITDYQQNEGKKDKFWNEVDVEKMEVNISYDLQAFFKEFNELKISSIAERAELNPSLLRQYATGNKYPSADQVKKIEVALHTLATKLKKVAIYAG
jgi:predicted RNase H-like HicB family nuclease